MRTVPLTLLAAFLGAELCCASESDGCPDFSQSVDWLGELGCDWGLERDRSSVLGDENALDDLYHEALDWKDDLVEDDDRLSMPVNFGAYHW